MAAVASLTAKSQPTIHVIATTFEGTRAALRAAVPLAKGSRAKLVVIVPRIVPYPADLQSSADSTPFNARRYRDVIEELGGDARIEVCMCRSMQDIVARALPADTQVVVGGATGRWLTSPEERFTDRLTRAGRRVIFVAATIIAAMAVATNARAQTPRPSSDDVLRRIAALEAEVAALKAEVEGGRAAAASDGEKAAAQDRAPSDTVTYGVALDTYYGYNFNRPIGRINLLRAYDVKSNNFSLNQANVVVESAPNLDAGRRFGGRLDLQYGQATETLQGSLVNEPRPWVYRNIFQAYGTYVLPVGSGLTIDFGKWASSLGF